MYKKAEETKMKNELSEYKYITNDFYQNVKEIIEQSRKRIYRNIASEILVAYWQIGKMIVEKQGGDTRAEYGSGLVKELSIQMTKDFGPGYNERSLRFMRQFYMLFPIYF